MIIEINNTLVNTDNICSVKRYYAITDRRGNPIMNYLSPRLYITFLNGKSETIIFNNVEDLEAGYQTLKFCETVINKNK